MKWGEAISIIIREIASVSHCAGSLAKIKRKGNPDRVVNPVRI
jgi:hypothetical protein